MNIPSAARGFVPAKTREEKLLEKKVADAVKATCHSGQPRFTGFLNDREQLLAEAQLNRLQWHRYTFDGGYEGAERKMLCVFEDKEMPLPITCLRVDAGKAGAKLTHRDYLGAVLATGLQRDRIGDILVEETGAAFFVMEIVAGFLREEIARVGRCPVTVAEVAMPHAAAPPEQAPSVQKANVVSLRLDALLAAMVGASRAEAAALVRSGRVQVNHLPVETVHYNAVPGDIFSVRGTGKIRLCAITGESRKGRIWIEYQKY